jgi:transposase
MERYIGLDVHAASSTFAVLSPSGRRLGSRVVETNGRALVEFVKTIPGKRHVCLEEGTQSAWVYETLTPHVDDVVVAVVEQSKGPKDDERDAYGLAERLRVGAVGTRVFKESGPFRTLRELSRTHAMVVQDAVRVQNRIKSLYRSRGVAVAGKAIYTKKGRDEGLQKLPEATRQAARTLYAQYDAVSEIRAKAEQELLAEARRHPISRILQTCPGLGPIRVAQLLAIVVSPHRFRTKRQFWSYCGLAVMTRSSSDWVRGKDGTWVRAKVPQTRGLNYNHNSTLKCVFKGAATTVVTQCETEPLRQDYERLLAAGTKPNLAKLTLARKIAATALSMWKSEEEYNPKHRKQD